MRILGLGDVVPPARSPRTTQPAGGVVPCAAKESRTIVTARVQSPPLMTGARSHAIPGGVALPKWVAQQA
jgi:hypothetical protein